MYHIMISNDWTYMGKYPNIRIPEFSNFNPPPPLDEEAGCYTQLYMRKMCFTKEHILI